MANIGEILTAPYKDSASYFKGLSTAYRRQTGDASFNVVQNFLQKLPPSDISGSAIIHDNACGEGTATRAIFSVAGQASPAKIEATDLSPDMISKLEESIKDNNLSTVHAAVADSHELPFADDTFTLSVTNISVTNLADAPKALKEIQRTLQPGGRAVVSIWKRFTPAELIHQAQRAVKGNEANLMPVPQSQYFEDGYLRDKMIEAGFKDVEQNIENTLIQGEALQGLRDFMTSPMTRIARAGWTEGEEGQFAGAIDAAISEEREKNGGIAMSAWFVTGRK